MASRALAGVDGGNGTAWHTEANMIAPSAPWDLRAPAMPVTKARQPRGAAWPASLAAEALHGPLGRFVRQVEPHTEADPAAVLVQALVAFGNLVGHGPYFEAEADRHGMNLFAVMVGATAKGRKGTSWSHVHRLTKQLDETWEIGRASCRERVCLAV